MARRTVPPVTEPTGVDAAQADREQMAAALRMSVTRLARLLRQQDQSGMAPALATALASIWMEGPVTLSRLAALEQVTPPTVTKMVDRLEQMGYVKRVADATDRRVCRVRATAAGAAQLDAIRARRTEWLTARLGELSSDDLGRLRDVVEVLDHLVRPADAADAAGERGAADETEPSEGAT